MEKNEIFDFNFVDRESERKSISSFFEGSIPILILNGKSGVGKTSLLKVVEEEASGAYDFIFITKKENNKDAYLKILLNELESHFKKSIKQYLKEISVAISELSIAGTKTFLNIHDTYYLDHIIDALFDTKKFFSKNKMELEKRQLILDYLLSIKSKENTVLVLDNFMYCDDQSTEIILPFLQSCQFQDNLKIVIIMTDEYTESKDYNHLFTYLKIDHLVLNDLPGYEEFFAILNRNVNLSNENIELVKEIFEYCNGNPQKLKLFLTYAYQSDSLDSNNKFNIDIFSKKFYEYKVDKVKMKFDNLEKLILFIVFNFKFKIGNLILIYTIKQVYSNIQEESINYAIQALVEKQIFSKEYDLLNGFEYYDFFHSTCFYLVDDLLKDKEFNMMIPSLSNEILNMFHQSSNIMSDFGLTNKDIMITVANFSYKTKNKDKYINDIYIAADYLGKQNQYLEASNLYFLLLDDYQAIESSKLLEMAKIHYSAGKYERAFTLLNYFLIESYDYYYLKANVYSILLRKAEALEFIKKCDQFCKTKEQCDLVINTKIIIYHEMPLGEATSRKLFEDYIKNPKKFTPTSAYILRMSEDFCEMKEAEVLQKKAIQLIQNTKYIGLEGYFIHNLGVIYLRMNQYEKSISQFHNAIETLKIFKPHEISYCYNNLGLIYLLYGDFNKASHCIYEGLFWNKSAYTQIALLTNQMICFAEQQLYKNALQNLALIQKEILSSDIKNPDVLRKFYVNAAYVLLKYGDIKASKDYLMNALNYTKDTGSEEKVNSLLCQIPEMKHLASTIDEDIDPSDLYAKSRFDGWMVTLTHD